MAIDLDEVVKVGRLARLPVEPDSADAQELVHKLGAVIDYFDQLSEYEADPEPQNAEGSDSREADDIPGPRLDRDLFVANAPEARDGFLVVPQMKASS